MSDRRLTAEELASYLQGMVVGNPARQGWCSERIADHIAALEQELAEAKQLARDSAQYAWEDRNAMHEARKLAERYREALEEILKLHTREDITDWAKEDGMYWCAVRALALKGPSNEQG